MVLAFFNCEIVTFENDILAMHVVALPHSTKMCRLGLDMKLVASWSRVARLEDTCWDPFPPCPIFNVRHVGIIVGCTYVWDSDITMSVFFHSRKARNFHWRHFFKKKNGPDKLAMYNTTG